ncbi:ArsC/Spx/MgsR family protein [Sulfurimonas sp. C5]|uniref:ArsC/Spx/MgsR family protein n=1 Tax=Sulfurimonas sp. C5 TaxID=3036947 RepID=UPI00245685DD|nr:ArsC/Spx/MgsR family protein [Sulfurimonas sp. C5]MDH4945476.1 ArsC/Spx/MgsR family protein [Sulfurimonas sp. C5]
MEITFFEKPGCAGNAKQKKLLELYNISYKTENMLSYPWTKELLKEFFEGREKEDIFNPFAPKIKNKELDPHLLSIEQLVEQMIQEPILIKRPLLVIGEEKICGFDIKKINALLQKNICSSVSISTCQSSDACKPK